MRRPTGPRCAVAPVSPATPPPPTPSAFPQQAAVLLDSEGGVLSLKGLGPGSERGSRPWVPQALRCEGCRRKYAQPRILSEPREFPAKRRGPVPEHCGEAPHTRGLSGHQLSPSHVHTDPPGSGSFAPTLYTQTRAPRSPIREALYPRQSLQALQLRDPRAGGAA